MASSQMSQRKPSLVVCETSRRNANPGMECYSVAGLQIILSAVCNKD